MKQTIDQRFEESIAALAQTRAHLAGRLEQAASVLIECYRRGGGVFLFGNGGSAADAQHIAGELVGRFLRERRALKAEALTTDASVLTALGNDYDFGIVFARQLEANARAGDVAVALSTSGNAANVVAGLTQARKLGMQTVVFTGKGGGRCAALADVLLDVPSAHTPYVQQCHAVLYHILCELVEAALA